MKPSKLYERIIAVGFFIAMAAGLLAFVVPRMIPVTQDLDGMLDMATWFVGLIGLMILIAVPLSILTLWRFKDLRLSYRVLGCAPAILSVSGVVIFFVLLMLMS